MILDKIRRKKKLHWGVAGCGKFTETSLLPALNLIRRAKLEAVYSSNLSRARFIAEKAGAKHATSDFSEFLKSGIDAVYIAGANSDHYHQVLAAAKAGKHILCEKPLSITSAEAEEMVDACRKSGSKLAMSYVYRFHPLITKLKELVDNHVIGRIISIRAECNFLLADRDNFRYNKKLAGGGAIRDVGTHMIDLCRYIGGELYPLNAVSDNLVFKGDVEDFFAGTLRTQGGGYAFFQVSYSTPKASNRIEVIGSKGTIYIDNLVASRFASAKMTILIDGEVKKAFRKRANKFLRLFKSVNDSFLRGEEPLVTGTDGLVNMKLMEQLEQLCPPQLK